MVRNEASTTIDAAAIEGSSRSPSTIGVCGSYTPAIRRLPSTITCAGGRERQGFDGTLARQHGCPVNIEPSYLGNLHPPYPTATAAAAKTGPAQAPTPALSTTATDEIPYCQKCCSNNGFGRDRIGFSTTKLSISYRNLRSDKTSTGHTGPIANEIENPSIAAMSMHSLGVASDIRNSSQPALALRPKKRAPASHDTLPRLTVLGKVASLKPTRNKDNCRSYRLAPNIIFGKAPKATAGRPTKRRQPEP